MPPIDELCAAGNAILAAIVAAPIAWVSPARLAAQGLGSIDEVSEQLADLDVAGWISVWEREHGVVVTLSTLAAERLGVKLSESRGKLRWVSIGEPERRLAKAKGVMEDAEDAGMEWVADKTPSAEELVAAVDELEQAIEKNKKTKKPRTPAGLAHPKFRREPLPRMMITEGLPWPIFILGIQDTTALLRKPAPRNASTTWVPGPLYIRLKLPRVIFCGCGECGGRKLAPLEYCAACDRWGFNQFAPIKPEQPNDRPKNQDPEWVKHLAKIRRKREKEERRARHFRRRGA